MRKNYLSRGMLLGLCCQRRAGTCYSSSWMIFSQKLLARQSFTWFPPSVVVFLCSTCRDLYEVNSSGVALLRFSGLRLKLIPELFMTSFGVDWSCEVRAGRLRYRLLWLFAVYSKDWSRVVRYRYTLFVSLMPLSMINLFLFRNPIDEFRYSIFL